MDRILNAGFKLPANESVLVQSRSLRAGDACFDAAVKDVVTRVSRSWRPFRTSARRLTRPTQARSQRAGAPRSSSSRSAARRRTRATSSARSSRASTMRNVPSGLLRRRVRRRELGESGRHRLRERPQERGCVLDPAHADHPRRGVRRAGGRRHPAAAGAHGHFRDVRTGRRCPATCYRSQTKPTRSSCSSASRSASTTRCSTCAASGGACRGAERARGARSRRRHLGPLGFDLRPDRDGGDGRVVPDGRCHLRLLRVRNDDRRRCRDARLADRPSGAALEARRRRRPTARPARRPAPPRPGRRARLGSDRRTRPAPAAALGDARRRIVAGAGRTGASTAHDEARSRHVPEVARDREDLRPHAAGVPRQGAAGERRREGARRQRAGRPAGDRTTRTPALATGRARPPITIDKNRDATIANITIPIEGKGTDATVECQPGGPPRNVRPQTVGALPNASRA